MCLSTLSDNLLICEDLSKPSGNNPKVLPNTSQDIPKKVKNWPQHHRESNPVPLDLVSGSQPTGLFQDQKVALRAWGVFLQGFFSPEKTGSVFVLQKKTRSGEQKSQISFKSSQVWTGLGCEPVRFTGKGSKGSPARQPVRFTGLLWYIYIYNHIYIYIYKIQEHLDYLILVDS